VGQGAAARRQRLILEGHMVKLQPGSSWVVSKDAEHSCRIQETFTAVAATHSPAEVRNRDVTQTA